MLSTVARAPLAILLHINLHILKVKGHRIGLGEIRADHAGEVEAKSVFPRERPIVETRDILLLYVSEGKLTHGVGHDFQLPASSRPFIGFVFLQLDPRCLDNGLRQLDFCACQPCVYEEERRRDRLHMTLAHHEVLARNPERNRNAFTR